MNFIIDLLILEGYNVICVIIDRFIKERHYVPYITDDKDASIENITNMFIRHVFHFHELLALIISDRGL